MNFNSEAKMSELRRLWAKIARFFEALEGKDDPIGRPTFKNTFKTALVKDPI